MKIGFCGAQGTGKTSLATALVKDQWFIDRDWTFVPSTSKIAVADGYSVNREADPESQLVTTCSRIVAEYHADTGTNSLVTDRTVLDSLAYTTYQFNEVWTPAQRSAFYYKVCYGLVEKHMAEYDKLFYFPIHWPLTVGSNDLRDADKEYQAAIDHNIMTYIDVMDLEVEIVPKCSVGARVDYIKGLLLVD